MLAVVGCDGAGKSSAVRLLKKTLSDSFRVKQIDKWDVLDRARHPSYRFIDQDLPVLRRCVSDMPEVTRTLFLFWMLHGTLTPQATDGADVVLVDGYWPKHAASEMVHSGHPELIEVLSGILPRPDLTVFLDVDPAVAYRRRIADTGTPLVPYECGLDQTCSEAGFLHHQRATQQILRQWCHDHNWLRIDANGDLAAVGDRVLDAAHSLLAGSLPKSCK